MNANASISRSGIELWRTDVALLLPRRRISIRHIDVGKSASRRSLCGGQWGESAYEALNRGLCFDGDVESTSGTYQT